MCCACQTQAASRWRACATHVGEDAQHMCCACSPTTCDMCSHQLDLCHPNSGKISKEKSCASPNADTQNFLPSLMRRIRACAASLHEYPPTLRVPDTPRCAIRSIPPTHYTQYTPNTLHAVYPQHTTRSIPPTHYTHLCARVPCHTRTHGHTFPVGGASYN